MQYLVVSIDYFVYDVIEFDIIHRRTNMRKSKVMIQV